MCVTRLILSALAATLLLFVATTASQAIVPPKNCGTITVKHKRYNIKADQLPCRTAKKYAARYLSTGVRPRYYKCHRYRGSALVARCENTRANPDRTIFIIKR